MDPESRVSVEFEPEPEPRPRQQPQTKRRLAERMWMPVERALRIDEARAPFAKRFNRALDTVAEFTVLGPVGFWTDGSRSPRVFVQRHARALAACNAVLIVMLVAAGVMHWGTTSHAGEASEILRGTGAQEPQRARDNTIWLPKFAAGRIESSAHGVDPGTVLPLVRFAPNLAAPCRPFDTDAMRDDRSLEANIANGIANVSAYHCVQNRFMGITPKHFNISRCAVYLVEAGDGDPLLMLNPRIEGASSTYMALMESSSLFPDADPMLRRRPDEVHVAYTTLRRGKVCIEKTKLNNVAAFVFQALYDDLGHIVERK